MVPFETKKPGKILRIVCVDPSQNDIFPDPRPNPVSTSPTDTPFHPRSPLSTLHRDRLPHPFPLQGGFQAEIAISSRS